MIRLCRLTTNLLRLAPMKRLKGLQNAPLYGFFEGYKQRKQILDGIHTFGEALLSKKHRRKDFSLSVPITQSFDILVSHSKQRNVRLSFSSDPSSAKNEFTFVDHNQTNTNATQSKEDSGKSQKMKNTYLPHQIYLSSFINEKVIKEVQKACEKVKNGRRIKVLAKLIDLNLNKKDVKSKRKLKFSSRDSIGLLQVFLPSAYKGGDLIVSKGDQKHCYNFGRDKTNEINCVVFFSDSWHEITEVKSGCRLTLSYELFQEQNDFAIQPNPELFKMISALKEKTVNGGISSIENSTVLGYFCENYYGNEQMKNAKKLYTLLKGTDFDLFIAAKKCGAKSIQLKLFYSSEFDETLKDKKNLSNLNQIKECKYSNPVEKQRSQSKQSDQLEQDQQDQDQRQNQDSYGQDQNKNNIKFIGSAQEIRKNFYNFTQESIQLKDKKIQVWQDFDNVKWLNRLNRSSQYLYGLVLKQKHFQIRYCYLIMLITF